MKDILQILIDCDFVEARWNSRLVEIFSRAWAACSCCPLDATPMQVALAWLLQRSPNILLIPGTASLEHLHENLQSAMLQIPSEVIADLDTIGGNA